MAYRGEVENLAGLSQLEGKTPKYLDPQVRPPSSSGEKMGPQKEFGAFVLVSEWSKPLRGNNANRVIALAHEPC